MPAPAITVLSNEAPRHGYSSLIDHALTKMLHTVEQQQQQQQQQQLSRQ